MKITTTIAIALIAASTPALACAPAPTCWITSDPDYLRTMCRQSLPKLPEAAANWEEPEQVPAFIRACKKLGITHRSKQ
jgi:hypothetical protein